jgi:hypothetical protein
MAGRGGQAFGPSEIEQQSLWLKTMTRRTLDASREHFSADFIILHRGATTGEPRRMKDDEASTQMKLHRLR